jgi:hypothetical protein
MSVLDEETTMISNTEMLDREAFLARLATTAYQVALRHGIRGSFVELELDLWHAVRAAFAGVQIEATEGPVPCPR